MLSRSVTGALWLALAAGLFIAGCSTLPTTPSHTRDGAPRALLGLDPQEPSPTDPAQTSSASSSVYIRAARGGTVKAGNFQVVIPPLALKGDAIITVRQPDLSKPEVELSVTPESRNSFRLPVILVADVSPMASPLVATSYISWWDPVDSRWERCDQSSASLTDLTVQAPLMHFSNYRVETDGKAGW